MNLKGRTNIFNCKENDFKSIIVFLTFKNNTSLNLQIEIVDCADLEVVKKSVDLRQLLWDSLETWTARLEDWDVQPFHSLDPNELADFIKSNLAIIEQVQKGLPENTVVQNYQGSVDQMKTKVKKVSISNFNVFKIIIFSFQ